MTSLERVEHAAARARRIKRVLWIVLIANWAVAAGKLLVGWLVASASMRADGLHSFIDGGSNVIGLVAMHFASQAADKEHPYGHQKFEALASLAIGVMIGMGVLELGRLAFAALVDNVHPDATPVAFAVMVGTLLINSVVTRVERAYAKKLGSDILLADAQHTQSDVFVTIAVIVSLALSRFGIGRADGVVALGVLVFVAYTGFQIIKQSVGSLSDTARLDPEEVTRACAGVADIVRVRDVRSRGLSSAVYVDLKVDVAPELETSRAHAATDAIEHAIISAFPQVVDVIVHVEPVAQRS